MRALTLPTADGLGAAKLDTVPTPEPGAGEVRVALRAAALNHRELWIAKGMYPGMALPATIACRSLRPASQPPAKFPKKPPMP